MTETAGSGPRLAAGSVPSSLRERLRSALRAWVNLNIEICRAVTPGHIRETSVFAQFRAAFIEAVLDLEPRTVVDLGAGKRWHHNPAVKRLTGFKLVGVDIDAAEMAHNAMLDERVEGDVTKSIDLPPGSADLVTVRSGVEHFADNGAFLRNLHALLRPGGRALLIFPGRYAPFVLINRMLPRRVARAALHLLVPGSEGVLGFPAYYDRTTARQFAKLAQRAGFSVVRCSCSYYASVYFRFFAPLYVLSLLLDHLRHMLGIKELASFYLFVLDKQQSRDPPGIVGPARSAPVGSGRSCPSDPFARSGEPDQGSIEAASLGTMPLKGSYREWAVESPRMPRAAEEPPAPKCRGSRQPGDTHSPRPEEVRSSWSRTMTVPPL